MKESSPRVRVSTGRQTNASPRSCCGTGCDASVELLAPFLPGTGFSGNRAAWGGDVSVPSRTDLVPGRAASNDAKPSSSLAGLFHRRPDGDDKGSVFFTSDCLKAFCYPPHNALEHIKLMTTSFIEFQMF